MGVKLPYALKQDRLRMLEDRVKEEKTLYRPEQPLRVHEGGKIVSLLHHLPLPPQNIPVRG
jgi:hypothetical protein